MAEYNEILVGRFNRFLQKLTSIKGNAPAPQLSAEIGASIPLFSGVENRYLDGWERFAVVNFVAAVAAQLQGVRLRNPVGSNVIAVFESIKVMNPSAAADQPTCEQGLVTTDLSTVSAMVTNSLDKRGRPQPTLIRSTGDVTASRLGAAIWQASFAANQHVEYIVSEGAQIPLLPGAAIQTLCNVVNQGVTVSYVWRERYLEESERT